MATITAAATPETARKHKKQGQFVQTMQRLSKNKGAMVGLGMLILLILMAILAPVIAPYPYNQFSADIGQPPSAQHLMGTDFMGRDMFSRILIGSRYSLLLGFVAASFSAIIGLVLGTVSGYFGAWVDSLVMRFLDVLQAIPGMLLSICIATALGSGMFNTILALSIGGIAGITRMLRARILSERKCEYLEAASSINCTTGRIMFKHLLPNTVSPVIVNITMGIGATIMMASGLSFIGLGVPVSIPEWGSLLNAGRSHIQDAPHLMIWPGLFIVFTVLAVNLLGDGLRDAMDPRLKK